MTDTAKIARFYNENAHAEHERLQVFRLEYQVSLHIILESINRLGERFPGQKSLNILDLGGGTGRYGEHSDNYVCMYPRRPLPTRDHEHPVDQYLKASSCGAHTTWA
jgi:hypothetical protein